MHNFRLHFHSAVRRCHPRNVLLAALLCAMPLVSVMASEPDAPALILANRYHLGIALDDYWVSEKYDGIRGYWDGKALWTRGGEPVQAPAWFIAGWPDTPLDGELWAGRGRFPVAVATARSRQPDDTAWRSMHFMVFDLPAHPGPFNERLSALQAMLTALNLPWVQPVRQTKISDHRALQALLRSTVKEGGEGLMLHRGASLYRAERSDDLLKLKLHDDAEARVVAHIPGKGKYQGQLGALLVETAQGQRFKLGTGFSNAQRKTPPPVGSWVSYRYRGWNDSGIPRFASFLRTRDDWNAPEEVQR